MSICLQSSKKKQTSCKNCKKFKRKKQKKINREFINTNTLIKAKI